MNKQTYHFSNSTSNQRLRKIFLDDPELMGELIDAAVCNGIAADLYNLRSRAGITQSQLAQKMDIKQSNISRWETPGYQGYKIKTLSKIVRLLGGRLTVSIRPSTTYSYTLKFDDFPLKPTYNSFNTVRTQVHQDKQLTREHGYIYDNI